MDTSFQSEVGLCSCCSQNPSQVTGLFCPTGDKLFYFARLCEEAALGWPVLHLVSASIFAPPGCCLAIFWCSSSAHCVPLNHTWLSAHKSTAAPGCVRSSVASLPPRCQAQASLRHVSALSEPCTLCCAQGMGSPRKQLWGTRGLPFAAWCRGAKGAMLLSCCLTDCAIPCIPLSPPAHLGLPDSLLLKRAQTWCGSCGSESSGEGAPPP